MIRKKSTSPSTLVPAESSSSSLMEVERDLKHLCEQVMKDELLKELSDHG